LALPNPGVQRLAFGLRLGQPLTLRRYTPL
jgi:hypothetical protein